MHPHEHPRSFRTGALSHLVGPVTSDAVRVPVEGKRADRVDDPVFCATIGDVSTQTIEAPIEVVDDELDDVRQNDRPWIVIVWNDPINLMSYVTYVLRKLFGYSEAEATKLMLQVHEQGKAVVSSGPLERTEADVARLHGHGLWATLRQD